MSCHINDRNENEPELATVCSVRMVFSCNCTEYQNNDTVVHSFVYSEMSVPKSFEQEEVNDSRWNDGFNNQTLQHYCTESKAIESPGGSGHLPTHGSTMSITSAAPAVP